MEKCKFIPSEQTWAEPEMMMLSGFFPILRTREKIARVSKNGLGLVTRQILMSWCKESL